MSYIPTTCYKRSYTVVQTNMHRKESEPVSRPDLTAVHVVRVIEQCCFNSTPDPFNGQRANFILKPPKVIESRTHV